jgi:putative redox protein
MSERMTTTAELIWDADLRLKATSGGHHLVIDSNSAAGPSPMQTLAVSLAGCMAIDVVDIVKKGRHDLRSLRVTFTGLRAAEPPKRYEEITLHYVIEGTVPEAAVERAIALSKQKYCSVWHSMREDIQLTVTHEIKM